MNVLITFLTQVDGNSDCQQVVQIVALFKVIGWLMRKFKYSVEIYLNLIKLTNCTIDLKIITIKCLP